MADVDIDPFEEHESRPEEPTDENIPLIPGRGGVQTLEARAQNVNKKHHSQIMKGRKNL